MNKSLIPDAKVKASGRVNGFILRESLINKLKERRERILIFHAALGYGKTMLMNEFALCCGSQSVWCHLSGRDNEPAVFARHLMEAAGNCCEKVTFSPVRAAKLLDGQELILMLDDFQEIVNEEIGGFLSEVLRRTSPEIRLFLTTRGRFPRFLLRFLLEGEVHVVTERELAFSREETWRLMRVGECGGADREAAEAVYEYTEGWPAGVMFLNRCREQGRLPRDRDKILPICRESMVHDYIMYELFRKLPPEIQDFLKKTSVLEVLDSQICGEAAQTEYASGLLNYLLERNLFIRAAKESDQGYRYHPVFRDFLQCQLQKEERDAAYARAAVYCMENGRGRQALEYAVETGSWSLTGQVLEKTGFDLLNGGRFSVLEKAFRLYWAQPQGLRPDMEPVNKALSAFLEIRLGGWERGIREIHQSMEEARRRQDKTSYQAVVSHAVRLFLEIKNYDAADGFLYQAQNNAKEGSPEWSEILLERIYVNFYRGEVGFARQLCRCMMAFGGSTEKIRKLRSEAVLLFKIWKGQMLEIPREMVLEDRTGGRRFRFQQDLIRLQKLHRKVRMDAKGAATEKTGTGDSVAAGSGWVGAEIKILLGISLFRAKDYIKGAFLAAEGFEQLEREGARQSVLEPELQKEGRKIALLKGSLEKDPSGVHLFVDCFGDFTMEVLETGEIIKWRTNRAKVCMAYLFHMRKPVTREQILETLWQNPEDLPGNEVAALHNIFSSIRRSLAPFGLEGILRYENKRYSLCTGRLYSFREYMEGFISMVDLSDCDGILRNCQAADLYQDLYMKDIDGDWCDQERAYYERNMAEGLWIIGHLLAEGGDWDAALRYLGRAEKISPCRETVSLDILRCLICRGDGNALRQYYGELRKRYGDLVGEEPGKAVRDLFLRGLLECG